MGYLSDFQPLPLASRTLKEKYLVGAEKYLVSAKLIAYLKWLMNVAAFKDCGNVDHLLYYNKQVVFLNHLNNQLWRELLYTALDAWYSKFSGKPSKKQKGRFTELWHLGGLLHKHRRFFRPLGRRRRATPCGSSP